MGLEMSPDSRQNSQALKLMGLTPSAQMTMSSGQLNIKAVGDFSSEGRYSEHPGVRETISGAGCLRERGGLSRGDWPNNGSDYVTSVVM